jgi:hypothetical protein
MLLTLIFEPTRGEFFGANFSRFSRVIFRLRACVSGALFLPHSSTFLSYYFPSSASLRGEIEKDKKRTGIGNFFRPDPVTPLRFLCVVFLPRLRRKFPLGAAHRLTKKRHPTGATAA